jgi:hypothetical protein
MEVTPMADSITAEQTLPPGYIDPEHSGADRKLLEVFYAACNSEGGAADEIHLRGIRAVLAAQPAPPAEGEVSDEELLALKSWSGSTAFESDLVDICRAAIALDRSRRAPVQPADEEVAKLVAWLKETGRELSSDLIGDAVDPLAAERFFRIADLLQHLHPPQPVAVSERLPEPEDCDAEGRCWLLTVEDEYPQWRLHSIEGALPGGTMIWVPVDSSPGVMVDCFYTSHWLPAHAIPIPRSENV